MKNTTSPQSFAFYYEKLMEILKYENVSDSYYEKMETGYKSFTRFIQSKGIDDLRAVTEEDVQAYQDYIYHYRNKKNQPYSVKSQITMLSQITCFYRRLVNAKILPFNPAARIKLPRLTKKLPSGILDKKEVKKLFEVPDLKSLYGFRDRTMLELMLSCAPRAQEVCSLKVQNVDFENELLTIRKGKWRKDRVVPIGQKALAFLKEYTEKVRPHLLKARSKDYLFICRHGGPLGKAGLHTNLAAMSEKAGIPRVNSHFFRYTLGTWLLQERVDVRSIQLLLGLDNLSTVQSYAMVLSADLKKVHGQTHPRCLVESSRVKYRGEGAIG